MMLFLKKSNKHVKKYEVPSRVYCNCYRRHFLNANAISYNLVAKLYQEQAEVFRGTENDWVLSVQNSCIIKTLKLCRVSLLHLRKNINISKEKIYCKTSLTFRRSYEWEDCTKVSDIRDVLKNATQNLNKYQVDLLYFRVNVVCPFLPRHVSVRK